ncbi:MAG: hypothetical protein ABL894_06215, partial [Hyphomicrobium sp.]
TLEAHDSSVIQIEKSAVEPSRNKEADFSIIILASADSMTTHEVGMQKIFLLVSFPGLMSATV